METIKIHKALRFCKQIHPSIQLKSQMMHFLFLGAYNLLRSLKIPV